MKSARTYLILVLGLTTLAGSALAWMQYQELIQLRAELLNPDERTDLEKRLADAQRGLRDLQDQLMALRGRVGENRPEGAVADDNRGRRGPGGRASWQAIMNDPKFQTLLAVQRKAALDAHYAPLFKTLNLTPQQLDQFKNLLVEKQQAVQDAMNAAREQGINPRTDPVAFQQAVSDAQAAVDAQIQQSLGAAGYADYTQYVQMLPAINTVSQVAQSLSFTDPLTGAQANQVAAIIQANAPQRAGNGTAGITGGGGGFGGFGGGGFGGGNQTVPITPAALQAISQSGLLDSTQTQEFVSAAAASEAQAEAQRTFIRQAQAQQATTP